MPHLILTPGDPTGIGPEITAKALRRLFEFPKDLKLTIIGSMKALHSAAERSSVSLPRMGGEHLVEYVAIEDNKPGAVAFQSIDAAVKSISERKGDALVTGPISKRHLSDAGYKYNGHTEILEELAQRYF